MSRGVSIAIVVVCALFFCSEAKSYNFLDIHPTTGEPIRWDKSRNIEYWVDPGTLGRFSKEQILTLIQEAMKVWENASPYADVPKFEFAGYLPEDVNGTNYQKYATRETCYTDDLSSCETEAQKNLQTVIILDDDNQVFSKANLCGLVSSCLAVAGVRVIEGNASNPGFAQQGIVALSGGLGGGLSIKVHTVVGIIVHELGHFLGLAHSSVNQGAYIENDDDLARYIPTMFSSAIIDADDPFMVSLSPDDIAGISVLYPSGSFVSEASRIKGKVLKSAGLPNYYVNLIARNQEDPLCEAHSFLAGRICQFASSAEFCEEPVDNNSEYMIWRLPPGSYTLEVEEVADRNLALTLAPGLIPDIDVIYGDAEFWNEGDVAGDPSNLTSTAITLAAGETRENVDIVLNRSEVTEDRIKYIPLDTFTPGPGTRCPEEPPIDYAALIGIDESDDGGTTDGGDSSPSSGGCSLISH